MIPEWLAVTLSQQGIYAQGLQSPRPIACILEHGMEASLLFKHGIRPQR